jgi:dephospho-CoA kinase
MKPNASKKSSNSKVWGLTGGIASGKSTAAKFFKEAGLPVVDADLIARDLRAQGGAAYEPIFKRFGTTNASRLREIVFNDAQAKKDLEGILHPLIRFESDVRIKAAAEGGKTVIYEAALLVEANRYQQLTGLIVIQAPYELRLQRLLTRDQANPELAKKILDSQISDADRNRAATHVLNNGGTPQELQQEILRIIPKL